MSGTILPAPGPVENSSSLERLLWTDILEYLVDGSDYDDRLRAVKRVSLTSKAFRALAAPIIFRDLTVDDEGKLERLYDVFQSNPSLPRHVRRFALHESAWSMDWIPFRKAGEIATLVAPHLQKFVYQVDAWYLQDLPRDSDDFDLCVERFFTFFKHAETIVVIGAVGYINMDWIAECFAYGTSVAVKELVLVNEDSQGTPPQFTAQPLPPSLRKLKIEFRYDMPQLQKWVKGHPSLEDVELRSLVFRNPGDIARFADAFTSLAPRLRRFQAHLFYNQGADGVAQHEAVKQALMRVLQSCAVLEELALSFVKLDAQLLDAIPKTVVSLSLYQEPLSDSGSADEHERMRAALLSLGSRRMSYLHVYHRFRDNVGMEANVGVQAELRKFTPDAEFVRGR